MSYLIYSVVVIVILMAVLTWAIRSGQFRNQDRARYLPLEDGAEARQPSGQTPHRRQRRGIMVVAAAVVAAVVLVLLLSRL